MHAIHRPSFRISLILMLLFALVGCQSESTQALTLADSTDIYAAVIRQLYSADGNHRQVLYVVNTTNDMPARDDQKRFFQPIGDEMQKGISERLQDLPARIVWVTSNDQTFWENGMVKDNGAVITLGNLYPQQDSSVQAAGGLVFGNMGGFGKTLSGKTAHGPLLERQDPNG